MSERVGDPAPAPVAPQWRLQRDERVQRYDVAFPMLDVSAQHVALPKYVLLTYDDKQECLRVDAVTRSKGAKYLGVRTGSFPDTVFADGKIAAFAAATRSQWLYARLATDSSLKLMTLGLVLAIAGLAIDASLAIGKAHVIIPISDSQESLLILFKYVFQAVGLTLVFWKGVLESK